MTCLWCEQPGCPGNVRCVRDGAKLPKREEERMGETIKLCAMLVRHVFTPDDEARDEEMRRPLVEQAMRAKREHDEMRRELAEARAAFLACSEAIGVFYEADGCAPAPGPVDAVVRYIREARQKAEEVDASDTTRREWEVRAAESYADGRKAGLREAAEVCDVFYGHMWGHSIRERAPHAPTLAQDSVKTVRSCILALAPPAAETVRTETIFGCRTCPASTPGWSDGRFASPGWGRIDHIDGPNAICPVCAADPTSLDCLREEYPDVTPAVETEVDRG